MPQVEVPFEVTGWEPEPLELGQSGAVLTLDYELP